MQSLNDYIVANILCEGIYEDVKKIVGPDAFTMKDGNDIKIVLNDSKTTIETQKNIKDLQLYDVTMPDSTTLIVSKK